ncbi:MAG: DUF1524 domain-containing protein [Marinilabiliaceae bacterium]
MVWWAFQDEKQELLSLDTSVETEHIFAKSRQEKEKSLKDVNNIECLGNKAFLEKRINIRASDYRFADKKKYYKGFTTERGQTKEGTKNHELLCLSEENSFDEADIIARNEKIIDGLIRYLESEKLLK